MDFLQTFRHAVELNAERLELATHAEVDALIVSEDDRPSPNRRLPVNSHVCRIMCKE